VNWRRHSPGSGTPWTHRRRKRPRPRPGSPPDGVSDHLADPNVKARNPSINNARVQRRGAMWLGPAARPSRACRRYTCTRHLSYQVASASPSAAYLSAAEAGGARLGAVRWSISEPDELASYICHTRHPVPLTELVRPCRRIPVGRRGNLLVRQDWRRRHQTRARHSHYQRQRVKHPRLLLPY
jgi:hypothetical protein